MTVPSLVNVVAISSVVLNGLFNAIFVVHDAKARLTFFLGK